MRPKSGLQRPCFYQHLTTNSPQKYRKKDTKNFATPCIYAASTTLTDTREYLPPQSSDSPSTAAAALATEPVDCAAHSPTSAAPPTPATEPQPFVLGSSLQAPECS